MFKTLARKKVIHVSLISKSSCTDESGHLALMLVRHVVSQSVPEIVMGEESSGHLIDLVVGSDTTEILDIVPEVRGGVGPVGSGWRLIIGN